MKASKSAKKLISMALALVMVLGLMTALPVSAAAVTATLSGGTAVSSGDAIPADSTLVFTLPNAITEEQLATAVTFSEQDKVATEETWNNRVFEGTLSGSTLTVDFSESQLAGNSSYRFTFASPAVDAEESFSFTTTQADNYFINDDFSRYPVDMSMLTKDDRIGAPFSTTAQDYAGGQTKIIESETNGGKALYISLISAYSASATRYKTISYNNKYAPTLAEGTTHKGVAEFEFAIRGNATALYELGGVMVIRKDETEDTFHLYARTGGAGGGNVSDAYTYYRKLCEIDAPATDSFARHTLKYIITTNVASSSPSRTLHAVWLDGQPVAGIGSGITLTSYGSAGGVLFNPGDSAGVSAGNSKIFGIGNGDTADATVAMEIYSAKYSTFVPTPVTVESASKADGAEISTTETLTYTFNEALNESSLSAGVVLREENKASAGTYNTRVLNNVSLDSTGKTLSIAFAEGDIAPGVTYQIAFTTDLAAIDGSTVAEEITYTYKTAENGHFINENFSRYVTGTGLGNSYTSNPVTLPWSCEHTNHGGFANASMVSGTEGKTALQVRATANNAGYHMSVGYRADYLPATETVATATRNKTEIDFEISGGADAAFTLGGALVIRRHETLNQFFLYAVNSGGGASPNSIAASSLTPLYPVAAPAVGTMAEHSLEYVIASSNLSAGEVTRRLLVISLDGNRLTQIVDTIDASTGAITYKDFPANGVTMTPYSAASTNAEYFYQNTSSIYDVFATGRNSALAYDTAEGTVGSEGTLRAEEALLKVYSFKHYEVPDLAVTAASKESGAQISTTEGLTFTFSEALRPASLAAGVTLSEEVKGSDPVTYNARALSNVSLDSTGKILTVTFAEGDIAPCVAYQLTLGTGLTSVSGASLAEAVTYTYTTADNGYYINDNFSRYVVGKGLGYSGSRGTSSLPLYNVSEKDGRYGTGSIVSGLADKTALRLTAQAGGGYYYGAGYRQDYLPQSLPDRYMLNTTEITFAISGDSGALYQVGGVFTIRKDEEAETFGLYYRVNGAGNGNPTEDYSRLVRLCDFEAPEATATGTHTLKYTIATRRTPAAEYGPDVTTDGYDRYLYAVEVDGVALEQVADTIEEGIAMTSYSNSGGEYFYNSEQSADTNFAVGNGSATGGANAMLDIYSFKHYPAQGLKLLEGDGKVDSTAGTFTKKAEVWNNTESAVNVTVVLAVYQNGTLVAVSEAEPASCPAGETTPVACEITNQAVAENESSYTYKLMLFNSMTGLRPQRSVIDGTVAAG